MSLSVVVNYSVSGIGSVYSLAVTKTGSGSVDLEESVAGPSSDVEVNFTCDVTACKLLFMVSDVALTVKTNSSSAPQETITLAAGVPLLWSVGDAGESAPFLGDVTKLFVTNAGASAATLRVKMLYDATP